MRASVGYRCAYACTWYIFNRACCRHRCQASDAGPGSRWVYYHRTSWYRRRFRSKNNRSIPWLVSSGRFGRIFRRRMRCNHSARDIPAAIPPQGDRKTQPIEKRKLDIHYAKKKFKPITKLKPKVKPGWTQPLKQAQHECQETIQPQPISGRRGFRVRHVKRPVILQIKESSQSHPITSYGPDAGQSCVATKANDKSRWPFAVKQEGRPFDRSAASDSRRLRTKPDKKLHGEPGARVPPTGSLLSYHLQSTCHLPLINPH